MERDRDRGIDRSRENESERECERGEGETEGWTRGVRGHGPHGGREGGVCIHACSFRHELNSAQHADIDNCRQPQSHLH